MARNLGIIVPYRDRAEHLEQFLPHLSQFFGRGVGSVSGNVFIKIIEQEPGLDFNRGLLNNIGYLICKQTCDYVCFHDVDYLPVRADYSKPQGWTHIVSKGHERLPDPRGFEIMNSIEHFVGGVAIFSKPSFEKINGYSNSYWGWGFEDNDLQQRCILERVSFQKRPGEFRLLPHANNGVDVIDGTIQATQASIHNEKLFETRFPKDLPSTLYRDTSRKNEDGLTSTQFSILERRTLVSQKSSHSRFTAEIIKVSF